MLTDKFYPTQSEADHRSHPWITRIFGLETTFGHYFEDIAKEDIFDYIPPQKTNKIFTPKKLVQEMMDNLEKECPDCFDDPTKTFIDLYIKSGPYITDIVKRLYNSPKIKALFLDKQARLRHIFEHQVYGLAPTEIIYRIATAYIPSALPLSNITCANGMP